MSGAKWGGLPYKEAIAFFQEKLLIPSSQWSDLVGSIHAKGFTVAGATKLELLHDLYNAVQASINTGRSLTDFRKDFDSIVAKHGWSYNGKRGWRTALIHNTNKRNAYMAGRWEQLQRVKARRPYLIYMTVGDKRVRDEHRKWHMLALHIDDPFWKTHFPPNGWLCRCTVRSASQADLDRLGLKVANVSQVDLEHFDHVDPSSGEVVRKLPGIDIGWDYNVGQAWLAPEVVFGQQLMEVPNQMRDNALRWFDTTIYDAAFKQMVDTSAQQIAKGNATPIGLASTAGYFSPAVLDFLELKDQTPFGATVIATDKDIYHALRSSKVERGAAIPVSIASSFPSIIRKPDAVLFNKDDNTIVYAKKLNDGRYAKFVIKTNLKRKFKTSKSRFKEFLNTVITAGIVQPYNLTQRNYELIEGQIDN